MAMSLTIALGNRGSAGPIKADQPIDLVVTVANSGASSLTLTALSPSVANIGTPGPAAATLDGPFWLSPNQPIGYGNPVIGAGLSQSFAMTAAFHSPYFPGPSPQNPGGAGGTGGAFPANPIYNVTVMGQTSDGSVFTGSIQIDVLTIIGPFPPSLGGDFRFGSGFNFMNYLTQLI